MAIQGESILPDWQEISGLGQDEATGNGYAISPAMRTVGSALSLAGTVAGVFHGYKRSTRHPVWGAIGYGLLGGIWIIGIPVMLAQGFAKPKR